MLNGWHIKWIALTMLSTKKEITEIDFIADPAVSDLKNLRQCE